MTRPGYSRRRRLSNDRSSPATRTLDRDGVLLVGDVLAPRDGASGLVVLMHGDVDHEAVRGGAVPVVLAGLEEDAVAGPDDLDGAALALAQADALRDEDRLAVGVGVPGGPGAGREMDARGGER